MVRQLTRRLLKLPLAGWLGRGSRRGGRIAGMVSLLCAALPLAGLSVASVTVAGVTVAGVTVAGVAGAAAAHAAGPDAITITGPGIAEALTVSAGGQPEQFAALLGEVGWLSTRSNQTGAPDAGKLGDKYVLTVFTRNKPTQRYDLYPLAVGGPRVFRPASQPDKHSTTAAWFYGRLSLPDSLRTAGVPLAGPVSTVTTGGIGGGEAAEQPFDPNADLTSMLARWRQFLLLNGAVVVVIALGLAGTSLLVRRRVDRLYRRAAEQAVRAPVRAPVRRTR
jgi:hypothetical protein